MDDFPGLLSGEFGLRPQGKSAPMAGSRGGSIPGRSSDSMPMPSFSSSASSNARSNRESSLLGDPMPMDRIFGGSSKQDYDGGGLGDLDGFFLGGGSGSVNKRNSAAANSSASVGLDSVFDGFQDPTVKTTHSGPIFDKPVYDDDMFGGIPGLKTTSTGKFDDVFASLSSASTHQHMPVQDDDILRDLNVKGQRASVPGRKQSENASHRIPLVDDDILGNLSGKDHRSSVSERKQSADDMDKSMRSFDDLIPGFGSSSPHERDYSHAKHQRSPSQSNKAETSVFDDPFVELNSKSVPAQPSSGFVMNPLDDIRVSSGKTKSDISSGLFDDENIFNGPNKVMPPFSSEVNDNQKYKSSLKTAKETSHKNSHIANEAFEASINNFSDISSKKVSTGSSRKPANTQFNIPSGHLETGATSGRFGYPSVDSNVEQPENEHSHDVEEIWLTVSEVPLFTQPTNAPAPSRPPPPFRKGHNPFAYGDKGAYSNAKFKGNAAFLFQQRTQSKVSSEPFSDSPKTFGVSSVDELEDFAMGRRQAYAYEQSETVSSEEDNETNSAAAAAAAATAAALDNAEAKMKQARELRERRESRNSKNMDFPYQVKKDKAMEDFQSQESKEKADDFYHEQELREKEEKEKEKRRLERERERAAVGKALQEVRERAASEARERAVAEARQKAERAAVEKANAEARERAARAAVQKATAEARERAGAEARERASAEAKEKLAREAREKTAAIQREREAREREAKEREAREKASAIQRERERAAVQRATQDARLRAERAAVEKANREARERAAAAAREKLQKSENDLDSVFGMGSRATSEPKQRASTPDVSFDTQVQNKGNSGGVRTMPSASSSGMRKTSSANFLDDLNSVFGAPPSGGFQEIDGESEERRRARLERHQRTSERAAKALAEKNQRDMQVQMEQVERDRIAERLEIEIKRWAAGKEGNLRALLSTLQYVLWPECGWQAISLTDLITSASVKKVYRKATLHIHPDKVQQKGANLEQKIIAEKVFDLLKEAWNKFNSEELF